MPELGIRSEQRQELNTKADYNTLFTTYRATTLRREKRAITMASVLLLEKPSVLICMEAQPCQCHRSHLAVAVAAETGLPVKHLRG